MFCEKEPTYVKQLEQGFIRCDFCGEIVPECRTEYLDAINVCEDCLADFCKSYVEDFGDEYIAAHRKEFCLGWILPSYSEDDIVRAVLADYERTKKLEIQAGGYGAKCIREDEQEFCLESSDWQDFVRERL